MTNNIFYKTKYTYTGTHTVVCEANVYRGSTPIDKIVIIYDTYKYGSEGFKKQFERDIKKELKYLKEGR